MSKWFRVDVALFRRKWFRVLPQGSRDAYFQLLGYVSTEGVKGVADAMEPDLAASLWGVGEEDVVKLLIAAEAAGEMVSDGEVWQLCGHSYDSVVYDKTAAQRQKDKRARDRVEREELAARRRDGDPASLDKFVAKLAAALPSHKVTRDADSGEPVEGAEGESSDPSRKVTRDNDESAPIQSDSGPISEDVTRDTVAGHAHTQAQDTYPLNPPTGEFPHELRWWDDVEALNEGRDRTVQLAAEVVRLARSAKGHDDWEPKMELVVAQVARELEHGDAEMIETTVRAYVNKQNGWNAPTRGKEKGKRRQYSDVLDALRNWWLGDRSKWLRIRIDKQRLANSEAAGKAIGDRTGGQGSTANQSDRVKFRRRPMDGVDFYEGKDPDGAREVPCGDCRACRDGREAECGQPRMTLGVLRFWIREGERTQDRFDDQEWAEWRRSQNFEVAVR